MEMNTWGRYDVMNVKIIIGKNIYENKFGLILFLNVNMWYQFHANSWHQFDVDIEGGFIITHIIAII